MYVSPVSSNLFTMSNDKKQMVSEASTVRPGPIDPKDINGKRVQHGVLVKSEKTGRVEAFSLDKVSKDAEGDITSFLFKPLDKSVKVDVLLFNT